MPSPSDSAAGAILFIITVLAIVVTVAHLTAGGRRQILVGPQPPSPMPTPTPPTTPTPTPTPSPGVEEDATSTGAATTAARASDYPVTAALSSASGWAGGGRAWSPRIALNVGGYPTVVYIRGGRIEALAPGTVQGTVVAPPPQMAAATCPALGPVVDAQVVATDAQRRLVLVAQHTGGRVVYASDTRGASWSVIALACGTVASRLDALVESGNALTLLADGALVQQSVDGGTTWSAPAQTLSPSRPAAPNTSRAVLAESARVPGTYVAVLADARIDTRAVIRLSTNGRTWTDEAMAQRVTPLILDGRATTLADLRYQPAGLLAVGAILDAPVNESARGAPHLAWQPRVATDTKTGTMFVAAAMSAGSTRSELLSARTCRSADVRPGCDQAYVVAQCHATPDALASACVRVRAPAPRTWLMATHDDGATVTDVFRADWDAASPSSQDAAQQTIPLALAWHDGAQRLGLLYARILGDDTADVLLARFAYTTDGRVVPDGHAHTVVAAKLTVDALAQLRAVTDAAALAVGPDETFLVALVSTSIRVAAVPARFVSI